MLSAGLQGASAGMSWASGLQSMGYAPTGNPWFSSWTKSSKLLKENIFKLGTSKEGHNIYKFNY